jgi:hypothetical protein
MFGRSWQPQYHFRSAVSQVVAPSVAAELMGLGLKCSGIHVPADPPESSIRGKEAREFWQRSKSAAATYYMDEKTASRTAWRALRAFFRDDGKAMVRRSPDDALLRRAKMPKAKVGEPGRLITLGVLLEYTFINPEASLVVRRFPDEDPPQLYWSHDQKVLWVFPGTGTEECRNPTKGEPHVRDFKRWTQREAVCERMIDVPDVEVRLQGLADTVVYRSDKWHGRNEDQLAHSGSQEYIHQFGDGVGVWQDKGNPPSALAFMGGCLDMEERGIIH